MPSALPALAIDFGGTKVEAALIDAEGTILPGTRFRRATGPAAGSADLEAAVLDVARSAASGPIAGIGIGSAGPLGAVPGTISPLNLPAWREYPIVDLVTRALPDVPVTLRMDGLCITLAEHWIGAGRGAGNLLGMIVSTGIGGGLILGGRTVPGPTGNAGHIGHVEIAGLDDPCACGGRGCLEAVASGPNTVRWARSQGWDGETGEDLATAYAAADPVARAAVERSGRAIGSAIASATALLDLEVVAIGGGFSRVSPDLFDHIRAPIEVHDFEFVRKVRVVPSALSDEAPLVGAAALVHRPELL
jgi:glucokinase